MRLVALALISCKTRTKQFVGKVNAAFLDERSTQSRHILALIPEEIGTLAKLFFRRMGTEARLKSIGMIARIVDLGRNSHRSRREVLHLFELEVERLGLSSQFCHLNLGAARVARNEIRYDLLLQSVLSVYLVEHRLELMELLERRLAHDLEHLVGRMFRRNLQTTRHMVAYQLLGIAHVGLLEFAILSLVQNEVIAHATAYERFLDLGQSIDSLVDLEQRTMVGIEVRTDTRCKTRRFLALLANRQVLAPHLIHIGRRTAQVAYVTLEIGHLHHLLHLAQYRLLRTAGDELALMGRYGAERATAETASVHAHRMAYHLVGRNTLTIITRVRHARVRKVERSIDLLSCERRIRHIDQNSHVARLLPDASRMPLVALLLNMTEVLGLHFLVLHAVLEAVQHHIVLWVGIGRYLVDRTSHHRLRYVHQHRHLRLTLVDTRFHTVAHTGSNLDHRLLAHTVCNHVGIAVGKQTRTKSVFPVVVVRQSSQACLYATKDDRHIGKQLTQHTAIHDAWHVRTSPCPAIRRIGIVTAAATCSRIVVDHRIHSPRRDAEEKPRLAEFLEVAPIVAPVRLWHDSHTIAGSLEHAPDDSSTERRMIDVCITAEQNHVELFPSSRCHFFSRSR